MMMMKTAMKITSFVLYFLFQFLRDIQWKEIFENKILQVIPTIKTAKLISRNMLYKLTKMHCLLQSQSLRTVGMIIEHRNTKTGVINNIFSPLSKFYHSIYFCVIFLTAQNEENTIILGCRCH
jgi:hypothetical protein